jgi:hypothetical protein
MKNGKVMRAFGVRTRMQNVPRKDLGPLKIFIKNKA